MRRLTLPLRLSLRVQAPTTQCAATTMSVDFDYDENQGNSAHTECLLSMETDNNFYVATAEALP